MLDALQQRRVDSTPTLPNFGYMHTDALAGVPSPFMSEVGLKKMRKMCGLKHQMQGTQINTVQRNTVVYVIISSMLKANAMPIEMSVRPTPRKILKRKLGSLSDMQPVPGRMMRKSAPRGAAFTLRVRLHGGLWLRSPRRSRRGPRSRSYGRRLPPAAAPPAHRPWGCDAPGTKRAPTRRRL